VLLVGFLKRNVLKDLGCVLHNYSELEVGLFVSSFYQYYN